MIDFALVLIGIPIGIVSSLIAWWILFQYLAPKVQLSDEMSITPEPNGTKARYRIKIINLGKRPIIDVAVHNRLKIQGLNPSTPENWSLFSIKMSSTVVPFIGPKKDRIFIFLPNKTESFERNIFPEDIRNKAKNKNLTMEDILNLGSSSILEVVISATDGFSGAKKAFLKEYTNENLILGFFEKEGLNVVPKERNKFRNWRTKEES